MRYVISESRFSGIIDKYLEAKLEPHKIANFNVNRFFDKSYWVVNDVVIGEIVESTSNPRKYNFFVDFAICRGLESVFSLEEKEAKNHILRYMREKHNIDFHKVLLFHFDNSSQGWYDNFGR